MSKADKPGLCIVIDTREQTPWRFADGIRTVSGTLETGDYAPLGFEDCVAVERKSLADLIGCMKGAGRERFQRELQRLDDLRPGPGVVIVEATDADVMAHAYRSEMRPASVLGIMLGWMRDFPRVHWIMAGEHAAQRCYDYLRIWLHGPQRTARRVRRAERAAEKEVGR